MTTSTSTEWWQHPLRISQTNLQVRETPNIDPKRVMRDLAEMHNNVAIFNAGGIYAWYPTEVPDHVVNTFMDGRDLLGEAVQAAHDEGMRFVARVDFSLADDSVFLRHPDWFVRDPAGEPLLIGEPRPGHWSKLYSTCPNGPYRNDAVAFPVLREIVTKYPVDGLFINAAHFRPCWCGTCRRLYHAAFDAELPVAEDWDDPNWRRWIEWRYDRLAANFGAMYRVLDETRPGMFWTSEFGAITSPRPWQSGHDLVRLAENCTLLTTGSGDNIAAGRPPTWLPAVHAKFARAVMGTRVPWATVHPTPGLVWRHTGLPEAELRLWLAQVNAHGAYAWHAITGLPERHQDRRNLPIHAEFNEFVKEHERYFVDAQPVTPIALLWSRRALERYGRDNPVERWQEEFFGFCDALITHHLPFTIIPDEFLTDEQLSAYQVLVMPNAACLSSNEAAAISRFVEGRGGLVASYASGLYDEAGTPRTETLLAETLGVTYTGHELHGLVASYMRVEDAAHSLVAGLEETDFIPNEFSTVLVEPGKNSRSILTLVPGFAPASGVGTPPERASIPVPRTTMPLATVRDRCVYFANEIGRLAWRFKLPDHADLIVNAVRTALPEELPVEVIAPHGVQLSLFQQEERLLIHLVNAGADRPRADVVPIHDIQILLHCDVAAGSTARALSMEQELPLERTASVLTMTLPRLETWEIIALEDGQPVG